MRRTFFGYLPMVLAAIAVVAAVPIARNDPSLREELFLVFTFMTLGSSINIITGYTGYVSFGHIVFFGLGGYVSFWLMFALGMSFIPAALLGAVPAALLALLIGVPILRLRGAYFALATIGVNEAVLSFMNNFGPFGGAVGMFFNFSVYNAYGGAAAAGALAYYVMVVVTLVTIASSFFIRRSKFGLSLMAIREDQDVAAVVGIDPARAKVAAFVVSAIFPALAGATFFFKNGIIEPGVAFDLQRSIESLVVVVLGGIGTVTGPIIGAAAYEWLRGFLITSPVFASFQLTVAGLLLLVVVLFVTSGLVGWMRGRWPPLRRYVQ